MTLDEYQKEALVTAVWSGDELKDLSHWTLGVSGEAGEIAEKVKKIIRDSDGKVSNEAKLELIKEMGDVMWYLAVLAEHLAISLKRLAKLISKSYVLDKPEIKYTAQATTANSGNSLICKTTVL